MEREENKKIMFDYYTKAPSYIKMIVDMIPENGISSEKKYYISSIYNEYLNCLPGEKVREIIKVSCIFGERLDIINPSEVAKLVDFICSFYLNRIIFETVSRDKIFNSINWCINHTTN